MSLVSIIAGQQRRTSAPAQTAIGDTAALVLAANPRRRGLIIQNTGLTTIKINLGATDPNQNIYQIALKGCTVADDGSGATYLDDLWQGDVTAISSIAGGTMVITEILDGV